MTAGRLIFQFAEAIDELRTIITIADPLLDPGSVVQVSNLIQTIEGVRDAAPGRPYRVGIPRGSPLRTKVSLGEYEPGGAGGKKVVGALSAAWDIEPLGPTGPRNRLARQFRLGGVT